MSIQLENRTDNHIADETFLINHQNGVDNWTVKVEVLENASECLGTVQSRLKRAIINRRLFNGLGEIDTRCFESAVPECKLTPLEIEKRERRKEQNRRAAKRCREKKKQLQLAVIGENTNLLKECQQKVLQVKILRAEKEQLQQKLFEHHKSGLCPLSTSYDPADGLSSPSYTFSTTPSDFILNENLLSVYLSDELGDISPGVTFNDVVATDT